MRVLTGELIRLGAGTLNPKDSYYSVIQIGNHSISRVHVSNRLAAFLDLGEHMTLYVRRYMLVQNVLIGVKHTNGIGATKHHAWFMGMIIARLVLYLALMATLLWGQQYIQAQTGFLVPWLPETAVWLIGLLLLSEWTFFVYDYLCVDSAIHGRKRTT